MKGSLKISEALGQTLVVDNRGSNNGVVGAEMAAKATLLFAPAGTPSRVVRTIHKAIVDGLQVPEVEARINQL